ncbi:type ISP restriction/modification enzyme [Cellulomonas sp. ATA003]|uniref:type ISP restriction/modification enzyme n=1 Tax=Cellulomonas sp. ATA003 TaxID=3073064 RepID=UPI0028730267|nr:type ISP restriction/modification enzyme [Cellulomonas sp. ATA003]WNB86449.1 type ISP restriction/modification enzyme [Cellulomonas sp. ATA003]
MPALDAVMFLSPRKSVVDVVQSVGRVMRLSPGKQYGYIILPIGIPAGMTPEDALRDNSRYAVVWEVLQALRAHDERFNAMVNKIDLNQGRDDRVQIIGVGGEADDGDLGSSADKGTQGTLNLQWLDEWRDAIYAKIVTKVGDRRYWEDWAKSVADIARAHRTRIEALLDNPELPVHDQFDAFHAGLRGNLNDSISRSDAIDMLAQHLITRPVFDALFEGYSFTEHNPVSQAMQAMLDTLEPYNLKAENETLGRFYESVRLRAAGIDNAAGKQKIIAELYEKFFKIAFPRAAKALGIVYTPVEVVDFILHSVENLLGEHFGASLTDRGVHVLDPFTGTGTFIVRLLQSGLIRPDDLLRKYGDELHANEILLLAYYIAAINIEAALHDLVSEHGSPEGYVPFDGIVLTDTFQMSERDDTMDAKIFPANNARLSEQKTLDVRVVVGNPPYSVGQAAQNDNNANVKYATLDEHISRTYVARMSRKGKHKLFDSYVRAIRWASNRIGDAGVIGFVTNGGFLEAGSADGMRKTLVEEFDWIYVLNLRGNMKKTDWQAEGGQVFGAGSQTTVAVVFLVKTGASEEPGTVKYAAVADHLSRSDKMAFLAGKSIADIEWSTIEPHQSGDWLEQRTAQFGEFSPLALVRGEQGASVLGSHTLGLPTNRDAWAYNSSRAQLETNIQRTIAVFNGHVDAVQEAVAQGARDRKAVVEAIIDRDPTKMSWDATLESDLIRGRRASFDRSHIRKAMYRPFYKQHVYFDSQFNASTLQLPSMFPASDVPNWGFYVVGKGSGVAFSALATDCIPDLHLTGAGSGAGTFLDGPTCQQASPSSKAHWPSTARNRR